jgi:hypothetical protein
MKCLYVSALLVLSLFGFAIGVAGQTKSKTMKTEKKTYSTDLKELRTQFNKDKGKVRLVLLLAPS